ncbi:MULTISPECIES: DUF4913 domain-containing protein [Streptomyces]|jgi:hypothetical protein|uniref:DUF4913 domain-containing protein n=1 Tax=Streptomyces TaxID=1883 RepID=UPI000D38B796|nr:MULTISPECIES: DUF4913 domain-containing protein [Streptomyces]MBY8342458.1 DUF4913 domain-containing protein [Streptomyces plumbidurans]PTM99532.1 uncharacterized protein DUF4913 [Streptomyces sp. VMFN-G11Ma]
MPTETVEVSAQARGADAAEEADAKADSTAPQEESPSPSHFILYKEGPEYVEALRQLTLWTHHVLLPVYGREVTSTQPWCSRWWEHPEAVAQLHSLWLAWGELTGPGSGMCGPANWHRDYLAPVMNSLREPMGPFAGCKPGSHRGKEKPTVDALDPFGPPPPPPGQA